MKQEPQSRDALVRIFDPRGGGPILFVSGTVLLALLGNAVYSMLLYLFGAGPLTYLLIIVFALLALFFVIRPRFWELLRRRQLPRVASVPDEQRAEPHAGLIVLVGPSRDAIEQKSMLWHLRDNTLRHCWLVAEKGVQESQKYRDLVYWLLENNVQSHHLTIESGSQVDLSFEAVQRGIKEAPTLKDPPSSLIVDFTGGFKTMSAGAVLACQDAGVPMQYMATYRDPGKGEPKGEPVAMKVVLRTAIQDTSTV